MHGLCQIGLTVCSAALVCMAVNKPVVFNSHMKYLHVDIPFCVERNASYRHCMVQRLATFSTVISAYSVNLAEPVNTFCRRLHLQVGSVVIIPAAVC